MQCSTFPKTRRSVFFVSAKGIKHKRLPFRYLAYMYMDGLSCLLCPVPGSGTSSVKENDIYDVIIQTECPSKLATRQNAFSKRHCKIRKCIVQIPSMEWKFRRRQQHQSEEAGAFFVPLRLIWISPGLQMWNRREGSSGCLSMRERYAIPTPNLGVDMLEI